MHAQTIRGRTFEPDDLLRLQSIGEVTVSPDGQSIAYILKRSKSSALLHHQTFGESRLNGNDRGDLWLVPTSGGTAKNLTRGEEEGVGYWNPTWSPDGTNVAMLSNKGGDIGAWVWSKDSGRLRRLTIDEIDLQFRENPIVWISDSQVVFPVLPRGKTPVLVDLEVRAIKSAMAEWPKFLRGQDSTVSVVQSGALQDKADRTEGMLLLVDLAGGTRKLTSGVGFSDLQLSPSRRYLAFLKETGTKTPDPAQLLPNADATHGYHIYRLGLIDFQSGSREFLTSIDNVSPGTVRWSPDSETLSVVGHDMRAPGAPEVLYQCASKEGSCSAVIGLARMPSASQTVHTIWSVDNELIVFLTPEHSATVSIRSDWWAVRSDNRLDNLTATMSSPPSRLIPKTESQSLVGVSEGRLWEINLDGSPPHEIANNLSSRINAIVWPAATSFVPTRHVIIEVEDKSDPSLYIVDLTTNKLTRLEKPSSRATFTAFAESTQSATFSEEGPNGTYMWQTSVASPIARPLMETNSFLRDIRAGRCQEISYQSLDGPKLKAWIVLPVDYRKGTRYPMITWVYPGAVARETAPSLAELNDSVPLNLQLLASHGYAVLIPSMPLVPTVEDGGSASDPYMEMTNGVLPAVDKAVDLGIADPTRLGVMGLSYGGYSTYALITQTRRFQAAIALAGVSDLISLYGQFDARVRYDQHPEANPIEMSLSETGPLRMGNPPWKDLGRYIRNSPISYVDRVATPLLIIQGDQDVIAIQQGEEFFNSLYRQRKRAAIARYWGEGHVFESPANIRDMWQRIYAWFDEFFQKPSTAP
jgi:dipeptidyl aminopeptidase/acylaminoacyl peptidase